MTIPTPKMTQTDEALRLLAQMYAHWFMRIDVHEARQAIYAQIRDMLYRATSQQDAYDQLAHVVDTAPASMDPHLLTAYIQARDTIREVIQQGGNADAIIIGQTDTFQHLCFPCSQDEHNVQRVPFFRTRTRRPLLKPEICGASRSEYATCQVCRQPINPLKHVVFVLTGTMKHPKPCGCGQCNRAGIASLLSIYECDRETQRCLLPMLHQVAAPSKAQCVERAVTYCWKQGWYMFNKDSVPGKPHPFSSAL